MVVFELMDDIVFHIGHIVEGRLIVLLCKVVLSLGLVLESLSELQ